MRNDVIEIGLTEMQGEPRCRDIELAERLGFNEPRMIRKLIERHRAELELFGVCYTVEQTPLKGGSGGRPGVEYWLSEEQALCIAQVSSAKNAPAVRAMLIHVFVAWRRGNLPPNDGLVTGLDESVKRAIGGIVRDVVHKQIATILPELVEAEIAKSQMTLVKGITAGEVIELAGIEDRAGTKGLAVAVSHMLRRYHAINEVAVKVASLGMHTAYAFDPALCRQWLVERGKETILKRVQEKRGQGKLHLIGKMPKPPEPATPPA